MIINREKGSEHILRVIYKSVFVFGVSVLFFIIGDGGTQGVPFQSLHLGFRPS